MSSASVELLPCPFCRSKKVELTSLDWRMGVRCSSCEAQGPKIHLDPNATSSNEPAMRWNEYAINLVEKREEVNKRHDKKQIA